MELKLDTPASNSVGPSDKSAPRVDPMHEIHLEFMSAIITGTMVTTFGLLLQLLAYSAFDVQTPHFFIDRPVLLFPFN